MGPIMRRGGQGLAGVLGQAEPDLARRAVHPAGGQVGRVEEVGLEAGRAEGAGELDAVVERVADRRVAAASFVGLAPGDEELAATGRERWVSGSAASGDRQEAEQDEVDQRDQQLFQQADGLLTRDSAGQVGARFRRGRRPSAPGRRGPAGRRRRGRRAGDGGPPGPAPSRRAACRTSRREARARRPAGPDRRPRPARSRSRPSRRRSGRRGR